MPVLDMCSAVRERLDKTRYPVLGNRARGWSRQLVNAIIPMDEDTLALMRTGRLVAHSDYIQAL